MAGGDLETAAFISQPAERRAALAEQLIHNNVMARDAQACKLVVVLRAGCGLALR
jgi:hypothetical protein